MSFETHDHLYWSLLISNYEWAHNAGRISRIADMTKTLKHKRIYIIPE